MSKKLLKAYAVDQIVFNRLLDQVDGLRGKGAMKPEYYSRIKRQIREIYNCESYSTECHLIKELDVGFDNIVKNYL